MNYHTMADFRVDKQQKLDELFTQVLAALNTIEAAPGDDSLNSCAVMQESSSFVR